MKTTTNLPNPENGPENVLLHQEISERELALSAKITKLVDELSNKYIDDLYAETDGEEQQSESSVNVSNDSEHPQNEPTEVTGDKKPSVAFESYTETCEDSIDLELNEEELVEDNTKDVAHEQHIASCREFAGVEHFAKHFIDDILEKSVIVLMEKHRKIFEVVQVRGMSSVTKWPTVIEFDQNVGEQAIEDLISTWYYKGEWLYCIDFMFVQSDTCSDCYWYEVKWSIPTKPYPIPQVTASVFFTLEVSRIKPDYCPVEISYVFEGSSFVHTGDSVVFQEYWLFSIIDAKIAMYKRIKF